MSDKKLTQWALLFLGILIFPFIVFIAIPLYLQVPLYYFPFLFLLGSLTVHFLYKKFLKK